ncbi:hypothetical protein D3C78_1511100 [compost metagenome]
MAETWGWQHRRVPLVELPADQVLVPRELLDRLNAAVSFKDSVAASIAISELRALLQR